MAVSRQQGFASFKTIGLIIVGLAVAGLILGPVRSWAFRSLEADAARRHEFDRRVKAQRHSAIQGDLARAGITIETSTDSSVYESAAGPASLTTRIKSWWHHFWNPPADPNDPTIPVMRDSLGLLPGERAVLPDGRVVEYDTTTFHYTPPASGR